MCTLCESNGEQYWEFPVFARSEDSQGSARIKASKGFSKLDLQNNSPTKSGQEDKVNPIQIMMLVVMMLMMMIVMTMMMLMMMVSGVGWSGSKSCSSPIRPSTWTNVSKSSGDHDDDDDDDGGGDADDNGVNDRESTAVRDISKSAPSKAKAMIVKRCMCLF